MSALYPTSHPILLSINNNDNNNNNNKYDCKLIIEATGIVTRSLRKNLEAVPVKHSIDSLQKTAILGTSHIIRKVLQCEAWSLSDGDHRWFKRSTRKKRLVTGDIHTYSMVQCTSWEANWFAASQEIPRILWNPKVHYRTHKRPPPVPILGQPRDIHIV